MFEVTTSSLGGSGVFATQDIPKGTKILSEAPLVKLLASSSDDSSEKQPAADIQIPPSVPKDYESKYKAMMQVAKNLSSLEPFVQEQVLTLYHPSIMTTENDNKTNANEHEQAIVNVALEVAAEVGKDHKEIQTIQKLLLVWSCNSFQGGRIYPQTSRINHSCAPNAVIQTSTAQGSCDEDTQHVVAAVDIAKGTEITISYLGLLLYADAATRRSILKMTKYFECHCQRCTTKEDPATSIPCRTCHPRTSQNALDEDVQYDDDLTVSYTTVPGTCAKCSTNFDKLPTESLSAICTQVTTKVRDFLQSYETQSNSTNEEDDMDDELLQEHLSLAYTVMGSKHWTTNLLLLLHVDGQLKQLSQAMITTQEPPSMDDLAQCIDSIERVCRFVQSISMVQQDMGHVVGDAILGIARLLVSLGDVKSQKYASEWIGRLGDYMELFETEGKQKVAQALSEAWKKNGDKEEPASKKAKR